MFSEISSHIKLNSKHLGNLEHFKKTETFGKFVEQFLVDKT